MTWSSSDDSEALDEENSQAEQSSEAEEGEKEGEENSGSDVEDGSTSSEDLMKDVRKEKGASRALATQTPARRPEITVFVSTKSGMACRTQSKLRDEDLGYDTRWADMRAAVLAKGQGMNVGSLEDCCIYAVARNKNGEASFREAPSLLTCAADWGDMVKAATTSKGGKKRRSDAKDKGDLFFVIQVSPETQRAGKGAAKAGPATKKRRKKKGNCDDNFDTGDTSEEEEPCPIAVHELRLRLPVCRDGAKLATSNWSGELKTKVVATKKLIPPLLLYGDSGELAKTIDICDAMITRLGENADTRTSHYMQTTRDDTKVSTALFLCSKPRSADEGISEVASSATFGNLVSAREKGKGRTRKKQVNMEFMLVSKPSTMEHPYMEVEGESGTWNEAAASASQGSPARAAENRPPILMGGLARTAAKNKGIKDSAQSGQLLSALKGMAQRGKTSGALDLTVTHRRAIVDRILAGDLDEVSQTTVWAESYVRELPWQASDIDESKKHATEDIYSKLIASLCNYSEAMRSDATMRMPKPFQKTAKEPTPMERIAHEGLKIVHTTVGGGAPAAPPAAAAAAAAAAAVGESPCLAAAAATATNDHLEALQRRQVILEHQIAKLNDKLKHERLEQVQKTDLEAKVELFIRKIDELDNEIIALL